MMSSHQRIRGRRRGHQLSRKHPSILRQNTSQCNIILFPALGILTLNPEPINTNLLLHRHLNWNVIITLCVKN